tara:strand:- start:231 stop:425 length:195 start_codon:yes stop_codon:yes gene_type:complete
MARIEGHNVDGVSTNWNGVYSWDKNKNYLTLASDAYECTYLVKKVGAKDLRVKGFMFWLILITN